jgi:PAS domain S-box-containing protein
MKNVYEEIVENLPVLICRFLPGEGTITLVNKAYCEYFGKTGEELVGKSFLDLIPEEDHERIKKHFSSLTKSNPTITYEHPVLTPKGKRYQRWTDQALFDKKGNIVEYQSIGEDITEQVRAKDELRISENKYETIFATTGTATIITEEDSTISLINSEFEELSGFSMKEIIGKKSWQNFIHKDDLDIILSNNKLSRITPHLAAREFEFRFVDKQGDIKNVLSKSRKIIGTKQIVTSILDITDRKESEKKLALSEEKYRLVVENANEYILIVQDGVVKFLNSKARNVPGFSQKDFLNKSFLDFVYPEDKEMLLERHQKRLQGDDVPDVYSFRFIDKKGKTLWLEINAVRVEWEGKPATLNFLTDITQRKQYEESLKIMFSAIKSSINAIAIADLSSKLFYVNQSFLEMWGYDEGDDLFGRSVLEFWEDESNASHVIEMLHQDDGWLGEMTAKRKDGSHFDAQLCATLVKDDNGNPLCMMAAFLDVTNRNKIVKEKIMLEKQLQQTQKMEAIGTLAGGIAHDFNNILSAIIGYTELSLIDVPEDSSLQNKLEQVLNSGNRAKDLVNQILTFSQQRELERKPINLKPVVEDALKMIRVTVPSHIELFKNLECEEGIIEADPTQIQQIVLNLCTNAYHAVKDQPGFIEVILSDIDLDSELVTDHSKLKPGSYVRLTVNDTGHGMPPQVMEKIFDPYFTTKEKGDGTGLGLAVVHGIVQGLGGAIDVKSIQGKGTSFHVFFPKSDGKGEIEPEQAELMPRGHERILIVDDELIIVEMAKKMLEHLGYEVFIRTSSLEALEFFRVKHDQIDLVITDADMPKMTGLQLAERLLEIDSAIQIILGTGYGDMVTEQKAHNLGIRNIIRKPLIMKDLAKAVRNTIDVK